MYTSKEVALMSDGSRDRKDEIDQRIREIDARLIVLLGLSTKEASDEYEELSKERSDLLYEKKQLS